MTYPAYWREFPDAVEPGVFTPSVLEASDGHPLHVYTAGDPAHETLVVVSPPTLPFLLVARLAAALSRRFRVVAWEIRGAPYLDGPDGGDLSVARHARDLCEVLAQRSAGPVHYVGWCGGTWILSWAILRLNQSAASVSLIAPSNVDGGGERTPFQNRVASIADRLATTETRESELILKMLHARRSHSQPSTADEKAVHRLTGLNLATVETLKTWARAIKEFDTLPDSRGAPISGQSAIRMIGELASGVPMLLLHCRDDETVSYRCSLTAADRNPTAKLVLHPAGGHMAAYFLSSAIATDIENFIHRGSAGT